MDNAVQPTTMDPLYYKPLEILTHIAVDVVPTKPHGSLKVLYVATTEGTVKKITILPKSSATCTLEEWNIFPEGSGSQIMALHYLKVTVRTPNVFMRPMTELCAHSLSRVYGFAGLDLRGHSRSGVENTGPALWPTPEQGSVHERDGPLLRMERARRQVPTADKR